MIRPVGHRCTLSEHPGNTLGDVCCLRVCVLLSVFQQGDLRISGGFRKGGALMQRFLTSVCHLSNLRGHQRAEQEVHHGDDFRTAAEIPVQQNAGVFPIVLAGIGLACLHGADKILGICQPEPVDCLLHVSHHE